MKQPVVLVVDDEIFFAVRIESVLKKLGYEAKIIGEESEAVAWAETNVPALVIINFVARKYEAISVIRRLKALPDAPPLLCFMPHVRMPELKPQAREAGADLIVANSALSMRLPQLIARLVPLDGTKGSMIEAAQFAETMEE